jgi:hypothetical protein
MEGGQHVYRRSVTLALVLLLVLAAIGGGWSWDSPTAAELGF